MFVQVGRRVCLSDNWFPRERAETHDGVFPGPFWVDVRPPLLLDSKWYPKRSTRLQKFEEFSLLPENVKARIVKACCNVSCLQTVRLVCKTWQRLADQTVTELEVCSPWSDQSNTQHGLHQALLPKLSNLKRLLVTSYQELTEPDTAVLAALPALKLLHCSTALCDAALANLRPLTQLRSFMLVGDPPDHCPSRQPQECTPAGLLNVAALRSLTRLALVAEPAVSDAVLEALAALPKLEILCCKECNSVSNTGVKSLVTCTTLRVLDLSGCVGLTNATVLMLLQLPRLNKLGLANCEVSDSVVSYVEQRGVVVSKNRTHILRKYFYRSGLYAPCAHCRSNKHF